MDINSSVHVQARLFAAKYSCTSKKKFVLYYMEKASVVIYEVIFFNL